MPRLPGCGPVTSQGSVCDLTVEALEDRLFDKFVVTECVVDVLVDDMAGVRRVQRALAVGESGEEQSTEICTRSSELAFL